MTVDRDASIRAAILPKLHTLVALEADCLLIEELGIDHGRSRIDIAAMGSFVYGFEIKSASDSLSRLPRQIALYDTLVDFSYLVVAAKHFDQALSKTPSHWGIILAEERPDDIHFRVMRPGKRNLTRKLESLAKLLWRDEALAVLVSLGLDRGFRGKPARILHSRLASVMDLDALSAAVLKHVQRRTNWGDRQSKPISLCCMNFNASEAAGSAMKCAS